MKLKKHQLILEEYHITDLLKRVKPQHSGPKTYRSDGDRTVYCQLLIFANKYLQEISSSASKENEQYKMNMEQFAEGFFIPLFEQMINLAKRQCSQKAALMKILFDFYREGISCSQKTYQQKMKSLTAQYTLNLTKNQELNTMEKDQLKNQLKRLIEQNEKKWRTFYLIVRDNRVLRRHKGKLLRTVQEERMKASKIQQEVIELSIENQKNRLLLNYQIEKESLGTYIKNSAAIHKIQQFMKQYPKISKRLLKIHLHQLEIAEQNSLNQKIQYIIKAATQQEEIYDQQQDLVDITKGNKLLFNAFTQTEQQDKALASSCTEVTRLTKINQGIQTVKKLRLKPELVSMFYNPKLQKYRRRRRAEKFEESTLKDIEQLKKDIGIKQLTFVKKTVYIKIPSQVIKRQLQIQNQVVNCCFIFEKDDEYHVESYPQLPTYYRLTQDIKRSKQFIYNRRGSKTSRLSGFRDSSEMNLNQSQATIQTHRLISNNNIKSQDILGVQDPSKVATIKRSKQRLSKISRFGFIQQQNMSKKSSAKNLSGSQRSSMANSNKLFQAKILTQNNETDINASNFELSNLKIKQEDSDHSFEESKILFNKTKSKNSVHSNSSQNKKGVNNGHSLLITKNSTAKPRISGFAVNKPSKKNAISNAKNIRNSKFKVNQKSSFSRMSQINSSATIDIIKEEEINYTTIKQKIYRAPNQQKIINFISSQSTRMIEKLMKAIFTQRKQLSQAKMTLQQFIKIFLVNHYGSQHQYTLSNRITLKSDLTTLNQVFDIMLNSNKSISELQIAFGLFAKVLLFNGSSVMQIDCERANFIKNQIKKTKQQYYKGYETINLCNLYMQIHEEFQNMLQECELRKFIQIIVPGSQAVLSYQEIKDILSICNKDESFYKNMLMLRQFKTDIIPSHLCLFALRQKWSCVLNIQTFIQTRYEQLLGPYNKLQSDVIFQQCRKLKKFQWLMNLLEFNYSKTKNDTNKLFMLKYLSLLFVSLQVQKHIPLAETLSSITGQFESLVLKRSFESIQL